jgi:general secretion pathway protein G
MIKLPNHLVRGLNANRKKDAGYTLTELLIVLVILTLLIGVIGPRLINTMGGAKSDTAQIQIANLKTSLDLFRIHNGRYPSAQEGLRALIEKPSGLDKWKGPYLNENVVPLDPWGNAYHYVLAEDGRPIVYSLGADNAEGGEDEDADVGR